MYDNRLAHLIEAGSDLYLMPYLYDPCGLNQIYSLRYGTLPIVRAVGGLKDTVEDCDGKTGQGTGFIFQEPSSEDLTRCVRRGLKNFHSQPKSFS